MHGVYFRRPLASRVLVAMHDTPDGLTTIRSPSLVKAALVFFVFLQCTVAPLCYSIQGKLYMHVSDYI